jgi:hypothetical protein
MRWLFSAGIVGSLLLAGVASASTVGCSEFAPEFAPLVARLGPMVGEPTGCVPPAGPGGDLVQTTSTGFVYLRAGESLPIFTTGREFWALEPGGMEHWAGTPHLGFAPPGAAAPYGEPAVATLPPPGTYPLAEAVTVMSGPASADGVLTVQRGQDLYWIAEAAACRHTQVEAGQVLFVRWSGAFASPGSELVMLGGGACPILDGGPR